MKSKYIVLPLLITIFGSVVGFVSGGGSSKPIRRDIVVKARQYSYEPDRFEVNHGDTLHIRLVSLDVMHGFYLEGYDLDAEIPANLKTFKIRHPSEGFNWKDTSEIVIIANKRGKFRYRCSHTCGTMHPFMQGEMLVNPNILFNAGLGATVGFALGMLGMIYFRTKKSRT
ncbi:MAG: cytochrome c oxidase subunit [Ignavibacteria bacterium]|nr:cytochrome c oxidase subunit [Ignavibacteria bacterium]